MSDQLIDRRKKNDRRSGIERRKIPRRMGDVYPPLNSEEWRKIIENKIRDFAKRHLLSLNELKMIMENMDENG